MSRSLSSGAHSRDPLAQPGYRLSIVIASAAKQSIVDSRTERWIVRCADNDAANTAAHSHTRASQSHLHDTIATLSQIENAFTPHVAAPPSK